MSVTDTGQDDSPLSANATVQQPVLVVMGVSGSGKTTVARLLEGRLGWDRAEADNFHSDANIRKMASGHALNDDDRWPWLHSIAGWITERTAAGRPGIVACSALKRSYRDVLRGEHVMFVALVGNPTLLAKRISARHGHYMPTSLLDSQLATLEPPTNDEIAITVDVGSPPSEIVDEIVARLHLRAAES